MISTNVLRFFNCFRTPQSSPEMNQDGLESSGRVVRRTVEDERFGSVEGFAGLNQYKNITNIVSRSDSNLSISRSDSNFSRSDSNLSKSNSEISSLTSNSCNSTPDNVGHVDGCSDASLKSANQQDDEVSDTPIFCDRKVAISPTMLRDLSQIHALPEKDEISESRDSFDSCSLIELPTTETETETEFVECQSPNLTF